MGLFTLDEAKAFLNMDVTRTDSDAELQGFIDASGEVLEVLAGEVVASRTVTETVMMGAPTRRVALRRVPVVSLTSIVSLDGIRTWDVADFDVAETGVVTVIGGPWLSGEVRFTLVAGYETPPARYVKAAQMVLKHLWRSQRSDLGGRRGFGGDDESIVVAGYSIPRAAVEIVGPKVLV
ncbi:hypothetical protein ACFQE5_22305 [Pseudonocardia hispaniensis]|uniref:PhiE125 gp8 family phage protein n=1 Tax=Pseudonocardia hispaniensis TaxID=904933 RepID=A0ABW1J8F1_9PSEU